MSTIGGFVEKIKTFLKFYSDNLIRSSKTYLNIYDILLFFLNILVSYICSGLSLMVGLLSIDSIYSAIDFIKNNSDPGLTESQVLVTNNNLYKIPTIERSAYYLSCQLTYSFVTIFIFNSDVTLIKYAIGLTLLPCIFNKIIYTTFFKYFDKLTSEKNELIKKTCFEQIANTIIHIEKTYIESDPNGIVVQKSEILNALENLDNIKSEVGTLIKNILITFLMIYLRKSSKIYYKIAKYIYVYGFKEFIQDITVDKAKELFRDVIQNKKYDQLTKPMFIQSVIYLYWDKKDTGELRKLIQKFKYRIVVMFTIWTLGSFFSGYLTAVVVMVMSLVLTFTRKLPMSENMLVPMLSNFNMDSSRVLKFMKDKIIKLTDLKYFDDRTIVAMSVTIISAIFTSSPFLLSFINQFSGIILLNNITFNFIKILHRKTHKRVQMMCNTIKLNRMLSLKYVLIVLIYLFFTKISTFSAFLLPIVINFISPNSKAFKYLYVLLYIGMMNSRENYIKILFFGYIMSLFDAIVSSNVKITRQRKLGISSRNQLTTSPGYNENYIDSVNDGSETDYTHPTKKMAAQRRKATTNNTTMNNTTMFNSFVLVKT